MPNVSVPYYKNRIKTIFLKDCFSLCKNIRLFEMQFTRLVAIRRFTVVTAIAEHEMRLITKVSIDHFDWLITFFHPFHSILPDKWIHSVSFNWIIFNFSITNYVSTFSYFSLMKYVYKFLESIQFGLISVQKGKIKYIYM